MTPRPASRPTFEPCRRVRREGSGAAAADAAVTRPRFRYVTPVRQVRRAGAVGSCLVGLVIRLVMPLALLWAVLSARTARAATPTEDVAVTEVVQHVLAEEY